jgi:penicillin-binding protein 2
MRRSGAKEWPYALFLTAVAVSFIFLGIRLFELQVIKGDYYRNLSSSNHIRVVTRPAPRGQITDRNGLVLADNEPAFMVSIIPSEFDTTTLELVALELGMEAQQVGDALEQASSLPHRPAVLKEGMSVEQITGIAENLYRTPGVIFDIAPLRRYNRAEDFCHLLGYVGQSDAEEAYHGEVVGRAGLELSQNETLRGTPGLRREVVDAHGRVVETFESTSSETPVPGRDLRLTVDASLQAIAMDALTATGMPSSAVIIDYSTGEILCAASVPAFDPNQFARGISTSAWNALLTDSLNPLFCRAWAATYPPASTFKVVTATWLLSEGLITPTFMPDPCYGSIELGGTVFRCWSTHGRLNIVQALERSCDVFFYRACQFGTLDGLVSFAARFGLGSPLTRELVGEQSGSIPGSEDLDALYGSRGWGLGNLLNYSIGQGELLATPLQMAAVAGIIASAGSMPVPGILLGGEPAPPLLSGGSVPEAAWDAVSQGMRNVVAAPRGTLHAVFAGTPLEVWGKTGTAECPGENHALVIGFVREPCTLAFCVVVEHGGNGSTTAGPVARGILEAWLCGTEEED